MEKIIKPWVLIHNHLQDRDYPGSCNLAAHLEAIGYRTSIIGAYIKYQGQRYHYLDFIPIAQPDIIVLPKTIDVEKAKSKIDAVEGYSPMIVCLPTEFGAFYSDTKAFKAAQSKSYKSVNLNGCDLLLTTTEHELNRLKKICIYDDNITKFQVSGHPRIDFFSDKFSNLNPSKRKILKSLKIPNRFNNYIVTCATSFPDAHHFQKIGSKDFEKQSKHLEKFKIKSFDELVERITSQYKDREDLLNLIIELAKLFPNYFFLIKVHPAESFNFYNDIQEHLPYNIKIYQNGTSRELITLSNFHIHSFCTTGIEASIKNIPIVHFQSPRSNDAVNKALIKEASFNAKSTEDLKKLFIKFQKNQLPLNDELMNKQKSLINIAFGENIGESGKLCAKFIDKKFKACRSKYYTRALNKDLYYNIIDQYNKWCDTGKFKFFTYTKLKIKKFFVKHKLKKEDLTYKPETYIYPRSRKDISNIKKELNL